MLSNRFRAFFRWRCIWCLVNLLWNSAVWCHTEVAKNLNDKILLEY